jgi:hypothetical protein
LSDFEWVPWVSTAGGDIGLPVSSGEKRVSSHRVVDLLLLEVLIDGRHIGCGNDWKRPWDMPVHYLIWRSTSHGTGGRVVEGMFDPLQMVRPFILIIVCENAQHLSDCSIGSFHLAVGILVERRRHQ